MTCKDLKSTPRVFHDISIFLNMYAHIFKNVLSKTLAHVVICTLCKNIDPKKTKLQSYIINYLLTYAWRNPEINALRALWPGVFEQSVQTELSPALMQQGGRMQTIKYTAC